MSSKKGERQKDGSLLYCGFYSVSASVALGASMKVRVNHKHFHSDAHSST